MEREIKNLIREAISAIRRGDIDDGVLILERTVDPKYRSVEHAHGAYLMRDGGGVGSVGGYFAEALGHKVAA
ncbi:hypothetical protein B5M44_04320 [Shinella sumterensis]|nr:hypothetical protein B5M44_04320 [Shinella sumterensis]